MGNIKENSRVYLKMSGYSVSDFGNILNFRANNINYLIEYDANDPSFYRLIAIFGIDNFKHLSEYQILKKLNAINAKRKVVKASLNEDGIYLTAEILLDSSPEVEDFLGRLIHLISVTALELIE